MAVWQFERRAGRGETGIIRSLGRLPARRLAGIPLSYGQVGVLLAMCEFGTIVFVSATCALVSHLVFPSDTSRIESLRGMGLGSALLFVLAMQAQHFYRTQFILHPFRVMSSVLLTWTSVFGSLIVIAFFMKISVDISRSSTICFFAGGAVCLPFVRSAAQRVLRYLIASNRLSGRMRVVVLGDSNVLAAQNISANLNKYGYNVVRQFKLNINNHRGHYLDAEIVDAIVKMKHFIAETYVDEVFLAFSSNERRVIETVADSLRVMPIPVRLLLDKDINKLLSRKIVDLGATHAVKLQGGPLTAYQQAAKRMFDITLALTGLFLLAPFFLLAAIAIKADSKGPVLFRQRRAGFSGRIFKIYKFRSMTVMDDGAVIQQAKQDDKRVTRVGRILRSTSIDELPQLLNVLRGEMSLVGPRPHALSHDNQYQKLIATYALRNHMKPGITGWAQVNGCRGETADLSKMEARVECDIFYIGRWSFVRDIRIICMTILQVIRPKNVY